ncbi:hypothetical protein ACQEVB_09765 [Pseudonocardia sp. CA-107938]|uniref:hypothetical protein n=1 Tax=Pseudonocardia sp. CA-107938 TaxID=3240021 RepID=UPI003D90DF6C
MPPPHPEPPRRARHRPPEPQRRTRQRPPEPDPSSPFGDAAPDVELDSYLAALAPSSAGDATELTGRFGSAQVFALRLPELRIEQLRRLAAERGVSPGALAVDWVIERLDREDTPTGPLPPLPDDEEPRRRGLRRFGRR